MAKTYPLQGSFSRGIRKDNSRAQIPEGGLWNSVDYIPDLDAPLTKRGGWSYASNDISATTATASYTVAGAYPPFSAGAKNCIFDEDGRLHTIASNGTVTAVGLSNASTPIAPLAFHREKLIITRGDGTTAPGYYDGSTLGSLGGSPPAGKFSEVFKDFALLAGTSAQPNRVQFSAPGDPTATWDSASYIDISNPFTGIATIQNAILCFSLEQVERIAGNYPPPTSDMTKAPLFRPGCVDARSIVKIDDTVIWASQEGIHMTDGASVVDVTLRCGLLKHWRELMSGWASTWVVAAGRHRERWLILTVNDGTTFKDAFLIDPQSGVHFRLSNMKAVMFWNSIGTAPEIYWANRAAPRMNSGESMWNPASGVKNDADGTAVTPVVEFPWYKPTLGKQRWRQGFITYDMRDAASDNPTLTLAYTTTPESTSYTNVTQFDGTTAFVLAETSAYERAKRKFSLPAHGLGLKLTQTNASSLTRIWGIEAELWGQEPSRL